jgi:dCTP deaminase
MILTDREIQVALRAGQVLIEPLPDADAYSSTSVDLTLSERFRVWQNPPAAKGVEAVVISPGVPGFRFDEAAKDYLRSFETGTDGHLVEPGSFVLGWTREHVRLPIEGRLAARVEGKSSLARCGVGIHVTAPTIHSGFSGQIQLEIFNHSSVRVRLLPGMSVCQLIFETCLGTPEKGYAGMFAGQTAGKM